MKISSAINLLVVIAMALCAPDVTAQDDPAADVIPPPGAEVLVVAERPGPRLWRVTNGAHTLWILGTQSPLPQQMKWRSAEVETAIAASDEVLGAYSVSLTKAGSELFLARGETLQGTLPPKVYERWLSLKGKYIDSRLRTESMLPTTAALLLQSSAFERRGLTSTDGLWRSIYGLARLHDVPVRPQAYEIEPVAPRKISAREVQRAGISFLIQTMDRLEQEIDESTRRAQAWADGDMAALTALAPTDEAYAASFARSWPFLEPREVAGMIAQEDTRLAAALERALNRNRTTFAALPVYMLLKKNGPLSILSAVGYRIEQPSNE